MLNAGFQRGRPVIRCVGPMQVPTKFPSFAMCALAAIGDTIPDIHEGLNAGMWTIAVAATGNELGLSQTEAEALPAGERQQSIARAHERLHSAGAHYVVDGISDVPLLLDQIEARLAQGERP